MEASKQGKILVAIDGSESALQTVMYLSAIHAVREREVVLFSVYEGVPDYYWDISSSPAYIHTSGSAGALAESQRKVLAAELERTKMILLRTGFKEENVKVKLQKRKKGIARDIIAEALNGYKLVVSGRKGVGRMEQLIFGSVAAKLVEKITFSSLLLVGRDAVPGKLLVAVDGSEGAWKTIEFMEKNLVGPSFSKITLLHVIRGDDSYHGTANRELYATEEIRQKMDSIMEHMVVRLIDAGFNPGTVDRCIITNVTSRAEAIINHARDMGYGTIAIGRKGISNVAEFSMGRVCNKVIQLSRGLAVWVVR